MTLFETKLNDFILDIQDFYDSGQVNPFPSINLDVDELTEENLEELSLVEAWVVSREDGESYGEYWEKLEQEQGIEGATLGY